VVAVAAAAGCMNATLYRCVVVWMCGCGCCL